MSLDEIALVAEANKEQQMNFTRTLAWLLYSNAALTAAAVNNPKKFPKLEDAFPNLFEKHEQQVWRMMQARVEAFAARHNKKF
jgi:hypothetical protein